MRNSGLAGTRLFSLLLPVLLGGSALTWHPSEAEAAAIVERVGREIPVNSTRSGDQREPSVAALANGGFAVVWADHSVNPDRNVRARIFSSTGAPLRSDFVVHRRTEDIQQFPFAAGLEGGGFVVIWYNQGGTFDRGAFGQRLSDAGARLGKQFRVDRIHTSGARATVAALENGGFVTAWDVPDGSVYGQSFRADGTRNGGEFRASTASAGGNAAAAGLSTGNMVVAWSDVTHPSDSLLRAQVVAPGGGKLGDELTVNRTVDWLQSNPSVAGLNLGRFVVVWQGRRSDAGDVDILAQIVASGGKKLGPEIVVGRRLDADQQDPVVAGFPNGRFVVVWTDQNTSWRDDSNYGIRAQVFSPDGSKLGSEFQANRTIAERQENPSVAVLDNGTFVVVWTDHSVKRPDTDPSGIRGQIFRVTH